MVSINCHLAAADRSDLSSKKRRGTNDSNNVESGISKYDVDFHRKRPLSLTTDHRKDAGKDLREEEVMAENQELGYG